ncbi:MAG: hypothetical protein QM764_20790 [Chitinophagaceae bacterium]
MKKFAALLLLSMTVVMCRKDVSTNSPTERIQSQLELRLNPTMYNTCNWKNSLQNTEDGVSFIRIGFTGKNIANDFILLQLEGERIVSGRIISIHPVADNGVVSGSISIYSLDGSVILRNAAIVNGFIQWERGGLSLRDMIVPGAAGKTLPEVILVSTVKKPLPEYYYSLAAISGGTISGASATYSSAEPATGAAASGGSSGKPLPAGKSGSGANTKGGSGGGGETITVDFEFAGAKAAIDASAYIKCFDQIADAGSTCTIELFTDIPVDNDPTKLFDWKTESPGHCFLQLKKVSGSQSVVQNIGFYPVTDYKSILTPAPVPGKLVDNSNHEFNASIKMNLTPDNFRATVNQIVYLSRFIKYDIDEYNCTDFALEVFNYKRATPLAAVKIDLPGAQVAGGSNTPQGVYLSLQTLKKSNTIEAPNITTDIIKAYVGNGKGPCN